MHFLNKDTLTVCEDFLGDWVYYLQVTTYHQGIGDR